MVADVRNTTRSRQCLQAFLIVILQPLRSQGMSVSITAHVTKCDVASAVPVLIVHLRQNRWMALGATNALAWEADMLPLHGTRGLIPVESLLRQEQSA